DVRRLRLTLQGNEEPLQRDQVKRKPVGRAYAVVSSRGSGDSTWDQASGEILKTRSLYDPDIKGMLADSQMAQESSLRQLRTELQHFKEVRHSMQNIRERLYGRMNGVENDIVDYCPQSEGARGQRDRVGPDSDVNWARPYHSMNTGTQTERSDAETEKMREVTRRLYGKLQESERKHEAARKTLEDQAAHHQMQQGEARESLQRSEERVADRDKKVDELQRLMTGMEKEHQILATRMRENERQLEDMRVQKQAGLADRHRSFELEKEVEVLKEKISHLNDMLKSQQRKVRQMIEQIENSRSQLEEKDVLIQQLQERVEHLESENREMQDRLEYASSGEDKAQRHSPDVQRRGLAADSQNTHSSRILLVSKKPKALVRVLETS
ncbi:tuftelin 1a, partial [Mustelus asterias]